MAEINQNATEPVNDNLLDGGGVRRPGLGGYSMFRMLVPADLVDSLIGRDGGNIEKLCRETKARIKIFDGPKDIMENVVVVSAKEVQNTLLTPAIDGLLRVHNHVAAFDSNRPSKLLIPSCQLGSLIGFLHTYNSIMRESNCIVWIFKAEPKDCALEDDVVVVVQGGPAGVQEVIGLIASHLRNFLINEGLIYKIEAKIGKLSSCRASIRPPSQPWIQPYAPFGFQLDNSYPCGAIPRPMFVQPHLGYYTSYQPVPSSITTQSQGSVLQKRVIQIPALQADVVFGAQCGNSCYVPGLTGARVTGAWSDPLNMTLVISGTASQIQAAQQLIQDLLAEVAAVGRPVSQSRH